MTIYAPTRIASTVTASGAAVVGKHNPVDATAAALSISLPTGQRDGARLAVEKTDSTANAVTVTGNMRGSAGASLALVLAHETVEFVADSAGSWWPVLGHKTLAGLDGRFLKQSDAGTTYRALPNSIAALQPGSVIAHRNAGLLYPEGTLEGMRLAAALPQATLPDIGDFRLTADGVPVSNHDTTVDRITALTGNVSDFTIGGLLRTPIVDPATWFGGGWTGLYDLVTADRMLATFGERTITFEAKDLATAQVIAPMIAARGIGRSVMMCAPGSNPEYLAPLTAVGCVPCLYYTAAQVAATTAAAILSTCAANGVTHIQLEHGVDLTKTAALIAGGLKVWIYNVFRHYEIDVYAGLSIFGWVCDDPLYTPNKATPSKYRQSAVLWPQSGTWGPGFLDDTNDTTISKRGTFIGSAGAYRWQPTLDNKYLLLGVISPVANPSGSYTITVPVTIDTPGTDTTRWAGFFFGGPTDYAYIEAGGADANRNGYNLTVAANGTLKLWKITGGSAFLGLSSVGTAFSAGQTVTATITVTPTTITVTRSDGGPTINTSDTTWRGGYMSVGATGYGASGSRFSFGKIAIA